MNLPPFPVDNLTLVLILDALNSALTFEGPDGERLEDPRRVGGEFGLQELLNFYSSYDESKLVPEDDSGRVFSYPDPVYSEADVIRSLVDEVRRCRMLHT